MQDHEAGFPAFCVKAVQHRVFTDLREARAIDGAVRQLDAGNIPRRENMDVFRPAANGVDAAGLAAVVVSGRDENMSVEARAGFLHLLQCVRPHLRRVKEVSRQKRKRAAPLVSPFKQFAHKL